MNRTLLISFLLFASGCSLIGGGDPCADVDSGSCVTLADFALDQTNIIDANGTLLWNARFVDPNATDGRAVTLSCQVQSDLTDCEKSFAMPDLDRLPHGEAILTTNNSSTESLRGSFRITQVQLLGDGESTQFTGSVDELHFDTPDGAIVVAGGVFDLAARVSEPAP